MEPPSAQSPFAQCRYYPTEETCTPSPARTLLPGHRSYGLIRQSRLALPSFGLSLVQESLRSLLPAPAATGIFPTLSLRTFPRMLGPLPRRSHGVRIPVSSSVSSAFPQRGLGRLPASLRDVGSFVHDIHALESPRPGGPSDGAVSYMTYMYEIDHVWPGVR